jgi:hypothetical protein
VADVRLVTQVNTATERILDYTQARIQRSWTTLDDLSDESADAAIAEVVPAVAGAQNVVVALHAGYVNLVTELPLPAPPVALLIPQAAWNRSPIGQARRLVSEGMALAEALDLSAARAAQVHAGDVLRARSDVLTAMGDGLEPVRPLRWAKVPGPGACSWCQLVSGQLYYRPNGLPVHLNDRCGMNAVTPSEADQYTNASTAFSNYRWRSRVQTKEIAEIQRRMGESAKALYDNAMDDMLGVAA